MGLRDGPKPIIHHLILQFSDILEQTIQLLQVTVSQGDRFKWFANFARLQVGRPRRGLWRWLRGPLSEGFKFWFTTMVFRIPGTCCFLCFHESVVLVLVSGFQELIWHRRWNWMIPWMDVFRGLELSPLDFDINSSMACKLKRIRSQYNTNQNPGVVVDLLNVRGRLFEEKNKFRRIKFQRQTNTSSQFSHVQYTYSIQR